MTVVAFILRWVLLALAVVLAAWATPDVDFSGGPLSALVVAALIAAANVVAQLALRWLPSPDNVLALAALTRIARSIPPDGNLGDPDAQRAQAVELAARLGIETLDEDPAVAFSWDGRFIRTRSEPSVVIHEIAHWQLCTPERRPLYDFGLGAGPESGRVEDADRVMALGTVELAELWKAMGV